MRLLALSLAMMLVAGACGDDDGGAENTAAQNEENSENGEEFAGGEFCDAYVTAQATVIAASSGGPTDEVGPSMTAAEEAVPEELASQFATIAEVVAEAAETGKGDGFEDEEFTSADEEVDTYIAENCDFEKFEVDAVDYAFEGMPPSVPAGTVTFDWENVGDEVHEMTIVRLKDDSTKVEDLLKMSDKEARTKIEFISGVFGPPGTVDIESIPLEAGRYVAVCFLPVGATSMEALEKADGPPHVAKGMVAEFSVE